MISYPFSFYSNSRLPRLAGAALLTLVTQGSISAQDQDGGGEDVFVLDPFVVSSGNNVGYQVRNTLSATKFDAIIKEVPLTITSLTREFMEDTYSTSLEDSLRFSAGITTGARLSAEEKGGFNIRGLRSLRSKRNGITQLYSQDMTNVDRVEVVKGPMSLLYGQVEPGGIINYLTLRPQAEQRTDLQLTYGSYDHFRAQLNHTGPIVKGNEDGQHQVLYRLDTSYETDAGWRDNTNDERSFYSGLVQYKPFASSTLTIQWDYLNQNSFNAAPLPEYNTEWRQIFTDLVNGFDSEVDNLGVRVLSGQNPTTGYALRQPLVLRDPLSGQLYNFYQSDVSGNRYWNAYAEFWGRENNFVPVNAFNNVDQHTVSIELRQQINKQWNARLYAVHNNIVRRSVWGNIWALGISGDRSEGYSWNNWLRTNFDFSVQAELTGRWYLGKVENQTFIGAEFTDDEFRGLVTTGGASLTVNPNVADQIRNDPYNPFTRQDSGFMVANEIMVDMSRALEPQNYQDRNTYAAFISNLSRLMNDRLLVLGGIRWDREESQRVESPDLPINTSEEVSLQLGTSFRVNDQVNVYASFSESFRPQNGFVNVLKPDAELAEELLLPPEDREFTNPSPLSPISGEGYEVGAKFDLLKDRLSGSVALFQVDLVGVSKSFSFAVPGAFSDNGNPQTALIGNQNNGRRVRGFETELFIRPIENWQLVLTYAYLDSVEILNQTVVEIREDNNLPTTVPSVSVPDHQVGLWSKYSFDAGPLDGFSVGLGFNWLDQRYGAFQLRTENPSASSLVLEDDTIEKEIIVGSQILWDAMLSYEFESSSRFTHRLQLNVRNILDESYIDPGGMPQDPRTAYLSWKISF